MNPKCHCNARCVMKTDMTTGTTWAQCATLRERVAIPDTRKWWDSNTSGISFEETGLKPCDFKVVLSQSSRRPTSVSSQIQTNLNNVSNKSLDTPRGDIQSLQGILASWRVDRSFYNGSLMKRASTRLKWPHRRFVTTGGKDRFGVKIEVFDWKAFAQQTVRFHRLSKAIAKHIGYRKCYAQREDVTVDTHVTTVRDLLQDAVDNPVQRKNYMYRPPDPAVRQRMLRLGRQKRMKQ